MKAKLKDNFLIDGNHTLIAGAEVEIIEGWCGCDGYYYKFIMPDSEQMYVGGNEYAGTQHSIKADNLQIIDYTEYVNWRQIRIQAAIAAMQGMCSKLSESFSNIGNIAIQATKQADALIEELKKKRE